MVWALSLLTVRLISYGLTPMEHLYGIHGLIVIGRLMQPPQTFSALPPPDFPMRLALKLFRGEPAISGFDWNFSAIHTSSPPFSTDVGSDLQHLLRYLHPGHG